MILGEGYSKNIYGALRKYAKLPRPTEVWRNVPDKWTLKFIYLYVDLALSQSLSVAMKPMSIFNTIVGLLILFKLSGLSNAPLIIFGVLLLFALLIFGHVLLTSGFAKQQSELSFTQSPDTIEMRDNIRILVKDRQDK